MKRRKGFVSNSSSSSFILAAVPGADHSVEITVTLDVMDCVDAQASTVAELNDLYEDYHGIDPTDPEAWKNWEKGKEFYDRCVAAIEAGKVVLFGSFSDSSGNAVEAGLVYATAEEIQGEGIEVLHKQVGY